MSENLEAGQRDYVPSSRQVPALPAAPASFVPTERIDEAGKGPGGPKTAAAGNLAPPNQGTPRFLSALDHRAVAAAATCSCALGCCILWCVSDAAFDALLALDAGRGAWNHDAPNRHHPRRRFLALSVLAVDTAGLVASS